MNKLIKGSIAGAAGVALLLGGAGTFALWNDSAAVEVGSIESGTLTIDAVGTPTWTNTATDVAAADRAITDIASYRVVPGDRLELTQTMTIDATGDNLAAQLSMDDLTVTGTLKPYLEPIVVTATGTGVTAGSTGNTFRVAPSDTETSVTVTVVLELPATVSGTTAQNSDLDLSALAFDLGQIR